MIDTIEFALDWLWQTTWQATLLAAVLAIITRVFRARLSPGAVSLLWMLVFVRLAMPVLPGSRMSIFALFESKPAPAATVGWAPPTSGDERWAMPTLQVSASPQIADEPSRWMEYTALAVWLIGACLLMGHVIVSTFRFSRRLKRTGRPADARTLELVDECCHGRNAPPPIVLIADIISTPAIFGVVRPRLLIPPALLSQLTRDELRGIILHELEHLRRRHLLGDWVFMLIKAVHWFNPAAWWAHRQIRAARELICDQAVLARLDEQSSRIYGLTMLAVAGGLRPAPRGVPVAAFARDYKLLKQRIEAIASRRRYLAGLGIVVAIVLGAMFLTKPAPAQERPAPTTFPTTAPGQFVEHLPDIWKGPQRADDAQLRALLDRNLPEVRFENIGFADVIEFMRDVSGANIHVNWRALEQAGIDRAAPTSARLRDVKFSKALDVILTDVAGGAGKIGFIADQGVISISTVEELKKATTPPATAPAAARRQATTREAVSELATEANRLISVARYDQAVAVIKRILELDPANEWAKNALPMIQDRVLIQQQRDARQRFNNAILNAPAPAENAVPLAQLDRNLPEVRFDNIGFADVLDFLRDVTGANIFVNWRALEAAGIDRDAPVTARLRDVKFSKALETILRDVGGEKVRLGFAVDEGVISISTADDLATIAVTNVYDVQDLLVTFDRNPPFANREAMIKALVHLITDTVARDSWKQNQGKIGSISELNGQIIITQTPENHQQINRLLAQLREVRAIQISTETALFEMPKGRIAALGVDGAEKEWVVVNDLILKNLVGPDVQRLTAPRITTFNGQDAIITTSNPNMALSIGAVSTVSSDRKQVTMAISIMAVPAANGAEAVAARKLVVTAPDGGTVMAKLRDAANDREQWMAIKPTIIIQREREEQRAPFPVLEGRAQPQP